MVIIRSPPLVDAGPDQLVWLDTPTTLAGIPTTAPSGKTLAWSVVSGHGPVAFDHLTRGDATVNFLLPGLYTLRLSLTDSSGTYSDDVGIDVRENKPPQVNPGPARILASPSAALTITGTATDDWTAASALLLQWSMVSGPQTISTPAGAALNLPAGLPQGEYVFCLHATDERGAIGSSNLTVRVVDARGRTWTRNADFEEGYMDNVDYERTPDALSLSARGTSTRLSAIFHDNQATGKGGTYLTWFDCDTAEMIGWHSVGADYAASDYTPRFSPTATLQTEFGDVLVVGYAGFVAKDYVSICPAALRFGTVIGGTRVGDYLNPPFKLNTCKDRNSDGRLRVPSGPEQLMPWIVSPPQGPYVSPSEESEMLQQNPDETLTQFRLFRMPKPAQGWIANWNFDEGAGTSTTGVPGGALSWNPGPVWAGGVSRKALEFTSDGQFASAPNQPGFAIQNDITVSFWLRVAAAPSTSVRLIGKGDSAATEEWGVYLLSDSTLEFRIRTTDATDQTVTTELYPPLTLGEWHHVACTFGSSFKEASIYVDGFACGYGVFNGAPITGTAQLTVGAAPFAAAESLRGRMDDVCIFDEVLDTDQMRGLRYEPLHFYPSTIVCDSGGEYWIGGKGDGGELRFYHLDPNTLDLTETVDPGWTSSNPQAQSTPNGRIVVSDPAHDWGSLVLNPSSPDWQHFDRPWAGYEVTAAVPNFAVNPRNGALWYIDYEDWRSLVRLSSDWSSRLIPHGVGAGTGATPAGPIIVDRTDDAWSVPWADVNSPTVVRVADSGDVVGRIPLPCVDSCVVGNLALDARGRIWYSSKKPLATTEALIRMDPSRGEVNTALHRPIGVVDLLAEIPSQVQNSYWVVLSPDVVQQRDRAVGFWSATHDSGVAGTSWGKISWNCFADPAHEATLKVEARAAATQIALPSQPWTPVTNSGDTLGQSGQWIEVRVTFNRGTGGISPILYDLTALPAEASDVTIPVSGQLAVDDQFATNRGCGEILLDVLANDKASSAVIVRCTQPRNGTTRLVNGEIGYTPSPAFFGEDRFVYTLFAPGGLLDRGLVKVTISPTAAPPSGSPQPEPGTTDNFDTFTNTYGPVDLAGDCRPSVSPGNRPPVANRDKLTILGRVSASDSTEHPINVLANDTDPDPGDGPLLVDDFPRRTGFGWVRKQPGSDVLWYQPDVLAYGQDVFSYTIQDTHGAQATGTIIVDVAPVSAPLVTLIAPTAGTVNLPADVTITATVTCGHVDTKNLGKEYFDGLYTLNFFDDPSAPLNDIQPKIVKVEFFAGTKKLGESFPPHTGDQWTFIWRNAPLGSHSLTVVATDELGSIGISDPFSLQINWAGPANRPPVAKLSGFAEADTNSVSDSAKPLQLFERILVITGRPTVQGTIRDDDNVPSATTPLSYQLLLFRSDGSYVANVTPGRDAEIGYATKSRPGVNNAVIDTLDLTPFANGGYELELRVSDGIEEAVSSRFPFVLRTGLKLGQLMFQEQDTASATPGLPLTITRSYDSSKAWDGDFGYGWSYVLNDLDIEIDERRTEATDCFTDEPFSLRTSGGWDISLTLPDGRRTTFVYETKAGESTSLPFGYLMTWASEPGVTAKLRTPSPGSATTFGDNLIFSLPSGQPGVPALTYWQYGSPACPVENYDIPDLRLTLPDDTYYEIKRDDLGAHDVETEPGRYIHVHAYGKPHVTRIVKPNHESLEIQADRVDHYLGAQKTRSLVLERGAGNRIIAVRDDLGQTGAFPLVRYEYNGVGDLVRVHKLVNRDKGVYETTRYEYGEPSMPHYITAIIDPRGIQVARNTYEDGKLKTITDSRGRVTTFEHKTDGFEGNGVYGTTMAREEVHFTPISGREAVTIHEADAQGNVIYSKDHYGFETWRKFESHAGAQLPTEEQWSVPGETSTSVPGESRKYVRNWAYDSAQSPYSPTSVTEARELGHTDSLRTTKYEYNAAGQVTKTTEPGFVLRTDVYRTTTYDANGQPTEEYFRGSDPATTGVDGKRLSHNEYYPSTDLRQGLLHYSTDAEDNVTIYDYCTSNGSDGRIGDLRSVTVYPPLDNPSEPGDAKYISKTTYTYDWSGNRLTETRWKYKRDPFTGEPVPNANDPANQESFTTVSEYDAKGRVTKTTDASLATAETSYNSLGKVAASTNRFNAVTLYSYDSTGELSGTAYPDGTVAYEATYYEDGGPVLGPLKFHVVEDHHFSFAAGEKATGTRTVFDAVGRAIRNERVKDLTIKVTLNGDICDTEYDSAHACTVLSRTRTDYLEDGRVWHTIVENDLSTSDDDAVTTYEYSANGLQKTTFLPNVKDGADVRRTQIDEISDLNGNLVFTQTKSFRNDSSMPEAHRPVTRYLYDQLNRRTETRVCVDENDQTGIPAGASKYDWSNRTWLQIDADNHATAYIYDSAGRLGWVILDVDPLRTSLPSLLPTDRSSWETWAKNGRANAVSTATQYVYDELGQEIIQMDAKGNATHFSYDALGRRQGRYLPADTTLSVGEHWYYDFAEPGDVAPQGKRINKISHIDFKTQQLITTFDPAGRFLQKKSTLNLLAEFAYTPTGQRALMRDNLNTSPRETHYVYDEQDRLRIKSAPEGTLTYDYDPAGNLKLISARSNYTFAGYPPYDFATVSATAQESNPSGARMDYLYDARNRLLQVNPDKSDGTGNADAAYAYDPVGTQAKMTYRNGVETAYTYNSRNHLRLMRAYKDSALIASFDYDACDSGAPAVWPNQRRLAVSGKRQGVAELMKIGAQTYRRLIAYDYDNLNRLTAERSRSCTGASWPADWSPTPVPTTPSNGDILYDVDPAYNSAGFDRVGNRQTRTSSGITITTASGSAQLQDQSGLAYDANDRLNYSSSLANYDANGNCLFQSTYVSQPLPGEVIPAATNPDEYDIEDRLIRRHDATTDVRFVYDDDGNRVQKKVGSLTTYFLVDDRNLTGYAQVLEERTSTAPGSRPAVVYVCGLDLISQNRSGVVHFYGYDGHGSTRFLTAFNDPTATDGSVTETYTYDAFGILIDTQNSGTPTENLYLYTGEQWDPHLGMYYLRARYYHPETGRFWTMDTFDGNDRDPLSLHKYLYVAANPVNHTDPRGQGEILEFLITNCQRLLIAGAVTLAAAGPYADAVAFMTVFSVYQAVRVLATGTDPETGERANAADYAIAILVVLPQGQWIKKPLSTAVKDMYRQEARMLWDALGKMKRVLGDHLHHRIPLEWAHLFPNKNPNRLANILKVDETIHHEINRLWRLFKESLNGAQPTVRQVLDKAAEIDRRYRGKLTSLKDASKE